MIDDLFYQDGLLWIAMIAGGYGAGALQTDFFKGIISLGASALILVARIFVKKYIAGKAVGIKKDTK